MIAVYWLIAAMVAMTLGLFLRLGWVKTFTWDYDKKSGFYALPMFWVVSIGISAAYLSGIKSVIPLIGLFSIDILYWFYSKFKQDSLQKFRDAVNGMVDWFPFDAEPLT